MVKNINIKFLREGVYKEDYIGRINGAKSDWIDLRCCEEVFLRKGDFKLIPLGVAMQLPKGYEGLLVPRSSTFKSYYILMANSIGVFDESYQGDEDQWYFPAYAVRDTIIPLGSRIAQFIIFEHQPENHFNVVSKLGNDNRGGFGSTGRI